MDGYYPCCGKSICGGCLHSNKMSGNNKKCPFCNADRCNKTEEEKIEEIMKRVEANDAGAISLVGNCYHHGLTGLQQDRTKAMEMYVRAGQLGCSKAHSHLGMLYHEGGDMKKAKFHFEAAAMAGNEGQERILDSWKIIMETWNELLNIVSLQHQLGILKQCMN